MLLQRARHLLSCIGQYRHPVGIARRSPVCTGCRNLIAFNLQQKCDLSTGTETALPLPTGAQVVICGGGVIGTSVAYHLTQLGWKDIILLEQGRSVDTLLWIDTDMVYMNCNIWLYSGSLPERFHSVG